MRKNSSTSRKRRGDSPQVNIECDPRFIEMLIIASGMDKYGVRACDLLNNPGEARKRIRAMLHQIEQQSKVSAVQHPINTRENACKILPFPSRGEPAERRL